jgi:hypothetical protein
MEKQLREHLEELHSELESTEAVDDRSRELLGEILGDIQTLLDRSGEATSPRDSSTACARRRAISRSPIRRWPQPSGAWWTP